MVFAGQNIHVRSGSFPLYLCTSHQSKELGMKDSVSLNQNYQAKSLLEMKLGDYPQLIGANKGFTDPLV
jgi:hypothetical protein